MTPKTLPAKLGSVLREWRKRSGLTMSQLSERAQIDVGFLAYIETGKKTPSLNTASKLADALGITLSDLFKPVASTEGPKAALQRSVLTLCRRCTPAQLTELLSVLKILHDPKKVHALKMLLD